MEKNNNTPQFNGFKSQKDYELVLGLLKDAVSNGYPNGDLDEFIDTLMVTEYHDCDNCIWIDLNINEYSLPTMEEHRERVLNIIDAVKNGEYETENIELEFGIVDGLEDGKLKLSYDGSSWTIPFTEEAILRELLEEELIGTVERFVEFNKADIDEFFRG